MPKTDTCGRPYLLPRRRRARGTSPVVAAALWLLLAIATVHGQEAVPTEGPDADALTARIAELEAVETPDDDQTAELTELQSAMAFLEKAKTSAANTSKLATEATAAPDELARVQADLEKAKADLEAELSLGLQDEPEGATAAELKELLPPIEKLLVSAEADKKTAEQLLDTTKKELDADDARRRAIPDDMASAKSRQTEVTRLLTAIPTGDDRTLLDTAKLANLQAEAGALAARLPELDQELQTLETTEAIRQARVELTQARADQAARVASALDKELARRNSDIANLEAEEAEQASRDAASQHAVVRAILERNAELAAEAKSLRDANEDENEELETVTALGDHWAGAFTRIQDQIDEVGLNDVIGLRLRRMQSELRELRIYGQRTKDAGKLHRQLQSRLIELEGESIDDPQAEAERRVASSLEPVPDDDRDDIVAAATAALETQQSYLSSLRTSCTASIETLMPLHTKLVELTANVDEYLGFTQQRILWIQSAAPVGRETFQQLGASLAWITDADRWRPIGRTALTQIKGRPVRSALAIVPFLVLLGLRRTLGQHLDRYASKVKRASTDGFRYTARAAMATVLRALTFPALIWAFARLLTGADVEADFVQSCATALDRSAYFLLSVTLLWQLCRPNGLADAHFRWKSDHLSLVRRNLLVLAVFVLPAAFVLTLTERDAFQAYFDSLGRLMFCLSALALAYFTWRVLHPTRGVLADVLAEHRGSWADRLKVIWFPGLILLLLGLTVAACAGYFFTAREMGRRVVESSWVVMWTAVIYSVLMRWLFVVQRRLAVEQLQRRFEAEREAAAQREADGDHEEESEAPPLQPEDVELDVEQVSAQTTRLLKMGLTVFVLLGLYFTWIEVLPALSVLETIPVWPLNAKATLVDGVAVFPEGTITVAKVGLAAVVFAVTLAIARNIPGVLEIVVLQRLPMTAGGRYTTRTLVRYTILIVGIILTFNAIGIGWSKVQWLAAAVSVGLGFGLQEIFANFVSGLIILTERPVRVGDTVTVGGVSGTVTRIQMRATTVTDWDRKEMIIPNKTFVTGEIINWTLSSAVLRISLDIGIAYGSDTQLAKQLLLQVAHDEEAVLDDPRPLAFFIGFGDNSLNFQLRIYINDVDSFSAIRDRVLMAIDKAFREANIEISFPQRDIHIRSIDGRLPITQDGASVRDTTSVRTMEDPAAAPSG